MDLRSPVLPRSLDTVIYVLGSTVPMQWIYAEPEELDRLHDKITVLAIAMMGALLRDLLAGPRG